MPTYEFTCPKGHDFDKFFRSMATAPTTVACPVCGEPAERQMSAGAGLVFRGSGFYITDYGKDGKKDQKSDSSRSSESKNESGSSASPETSGASKPDTASSSAESAPSAANAPKSPGASDKPAAPTKAAE